MLFSIVTPSFNQGNFLRGTIESVLSQAVDIEYLILDGGSSDGSREIIDSYAKRLAFWCSEPDRGQYDAINTGFARSSGEIMGWLNSSDLYLPWTLSTVELIFETFPEIQWLTSQMKTCITEEGTYEDLWVTPGFSSRRFYRGLHGGPGNNDYLQQESCFWRRSLWDKIGASIDLRHSAAGDFWLWSQFFRHATVASVEAPLAAFRFHDKAKSTNTVYEQEVETITREMQKEHESSYPEGSLSVIRWSDYDADGLRSSRWKLEKRKTDSFLDARLQVESLLKKARWPLTKSLHGILRVLRHQ